METTTPRHVLMLAHFTIGGPERRTLTLRRRKAAEARKAIARFGGLLDLGDDATPSHRLQSLLWAQAHLEHVIALETQGRLGMKDATPSRLVKRHLESMPGVKVG